LIDLPPATVIFSWLELGQLRPLLTYVTLMLTGCSGGVCYGASPLLLLDLNHVDPVSR
jgi:hypothetical protein